MFRAYRASAWTALFVIFGCGRAEIGREDAHAYFNRHRAALERVVEQVDLCQPETGRIDRISQVRCLSTEGDPQNLLDAMTAADAEWIRAFYDARGGENLSLRSIHISVHSSGFSFAGAIEQFIYEVTPAPDAAYERHDDGVAVLEREPVTEAPHHWYWQKIDR